MPSYTFKCIDCNEETIKVMSITEYSQPQEHICECGGMMFRRFNAQTIIDECPGFYGRKKS